MTEKKLYLYSNGAKEVITNKHYTAPVRLGKKIQINEWTFSCLLFMISLSIVLRKLYTNYGNITLLENNFKYTVSPTSILLNISNIFDLSYMSNVSQFSMKHITTANERFVNINQINILNVMGSLIKTYGWLIKATVCGLIMMSFTWFIIYKDSSIPGINPPSPFSLFNQRFSKASGVQMNYLIGVLNGILIFIYMCL